MLIFVVGAAAAQQLYYGQNTCFEDDTYIHALNVGVVVDQSMIVKYGSDTEYNVKQIFANVSFNYQRQFNVKILIRHLIFDESLTCRTSLIDTYNDFKNSLPSYNVSTWILLTDCFNGGYPRGIADFGAPSCTPAYAVTQISRGIVKTITHEIGHTLSLGHGAGIMAANNPGDIFEDASRACVALQYLKMCDSMDYFVPKQGFRGLDGSSNN